MKELEKHKGQFSKKDKITKEDISIEFEGLKPLIKKYPETKDQTVNAIKKLDEKIGKEESNYLINSRNVEEKGRWKTNCFRDQ